MTQHMLDPAASAIMAEVLASFPDRSWLSDDLALLAEYAMRMSAFEARGILNVPSADFDDALALSDMLRISPRARLLLADAQHKFPAFASIASTTTH